MYAILRFGIFIIQHIYIFFFLNVSIVANFLHFFSNIYSLKFKINVNFFFNLEKFKLLHQNGKHCEQSL